MIAHEVGHVLSLNASHGSDVTQPGGYSDSEGSYTRAAHISRFHACFWRSRCPHGGSREDAEQASARFDEDPDAFVTDYAAMDPSEDFAESFACFVLGPEFLYDHPDLVRDRGYLRKGLSSTK